MDREAQNRAAQTRLKEKARELLRIRHEELFPRLIENLRTAKAAEEAKSSDKSQAKHVEPPADEFVNAAAIRPSLWERFKRWLRGE